MPASPQYMTPADTHTQQGKHAEFQFLQKLITLGMLFQVFD